MLTILTPTAVQTSLSRYNSKRLASTNTLEPHGRNLKQSLTSQSDYGRPQDIIAFHVPAKESSTKYYIYVIFEHLIPNPCAAATASTFLVPGFPSEVGYWLYWSCICCQSMRSNKLNSRKHPSSRWWVWTCLLGVCVECACSPCVHVGFPQVLQLPPTVQIHEL